MRLYFGDSGMIEIVANVATPPAVTPTQTFASPAAALETAEISPTQSVSEDAAAVLVSHVINCPCRRYRF
jgi:hypothetical protein